MLESEIWANQLLVETIEKAKDPDERTLLLFSHVINSYSGWLSRVKGTEITTTPFQERSVQDNKVLMQKTLPELRSYLQAASETELDRIIDFVLPLDGSQRRISVADALTHVITHSSYHRGQMMTRLKEKVDKLPLTTYIGYALEKGY